MTKQCFVVVSALMTMLPFTGTAEDVSRTLYLCDMSKNKQGWIYSLQDGTQVDGTTVAADKGCKLHTAVIYNKWQNINTYLYHHLDVYSWDIAPTNAITGPSGGFVEGTTAITIGAGGLSISPNLYIHFASKGEPVVRVKLSEDQTWRGPEDGNGWGRISMGSTIHSGGYYNNVIMEASKDVTWTLDKRVKVSFMEASALNNVDIIVNPHARLVLVDEWEGQINPGDFAGKIGAKSLTLKGGNTTSSEPLFVVGAKNPGLDIGTTYAPSSFDDVTVAAHVKLVDGASITGGTVDYALSRLSVSGGASVFSGEVTVKKNVAIDIAQGATFTFTGNVKLEEGASVAISGDGGFRYARDVIDWPVTGDGVILCDPAAGETILRTDLSGFSGKIRVAKGTLLIHPDAKLSKDIEIVTDEGASYRELGDDDFGDVTVGGRKFYRDLSGVAHPYLYMNSVSKNLTFGDVGFRHSADVEETAAWEDGAVCVIDRTLDGGLANNTSVTAEGLVVESTAVKNNTSANYFDGSGNFTIGERGIEFKRTGFELYFWKSYSRLRLDGDQVWRGPAAEMVSGESPRVCIGGSYNYMYPTGTMLPLKDGLRWTIKGGLKVSIYYPSNDLSRADVIVKSPAWLILSYPGNNASYPQPGNTHPWCGRLKANSLTLDGPNARLYMDYPVKFQYMMCDAIAKTVILKNDAKLDFKSDSTPTMEWRDSLELRAGEGTGYLSGKYKLMNEQIRLSAAQDATLDITAAELSASPGVNAGFALSGDGKIRLSFTNLAKLHGPVTVDGPVVEVSGNGSWTHSLAKASGFVVDSDSCVFVPKSALDGFAGKEIKVVSGTLLLESAASLPDGCKVVTEGDGGLTLVDGTGFDKEKHMGGTANVVEATRLIVTDVPRENEDIVLASGETLHVFGSGLKASSSVTLGGGSAVCFHRTAEISSVVSFSGAVDVFTDDISVEGRFKGKVTNSGSGKLTVSSSGCVAFEGSGTDFGNASPSFVLKKGRVELRGGANFVLYGVHLLQGQMVMTNCTVRSKTGYWYVGNSSQTGDVLCEIASGATWEVDNNSIVFVGGSNLCESRLKINGGTMWHMTYDTIRLDEDGTGNAVFELASGTLSSQRRILVGRKADATEGSVKFIWKGGVWKTGGSYPYRYTYLFAPKDNSAVYGGLEFSVEGPDCTLDFKGFLYPGAISNFYNLAASKMTGRPGARLTLKGDPSVATRMTLLDFEPGGMALDLNSDPRVDVDVVGKGDAINLGWVVPDTNGTVNCVGTASPLVADYVVPDGSVFVNEYVGDHWHGGFDPVSVSNLVFGVDSTYLLQPTVDGLSPLSLTGTLYLPEKMMYAVDRSLAPAPVTEGTALIEAGAGVEGECKWKAAGGVSARDSRVYAEENLLLFRFEPKGTMLRIR